MESDIYSVSCDIFWLDSDILLPCDAKRSLSYGVAVCLSVSVSVLYVDCIY